MKKHFGIALTTLVYLMSMLFPAASVSAATAAGAVNTFFNLSEATTLSVDMRPNWGEDGYHYYSLSPFFTGRDYGMYTGLQTNGNLGDGVDVGNIFIFSIWNATTAYPAKGVTATPFGGEGVGYSLRKKYNWSVGTTYTITLKRESYDSSKKAYRWSATVTNKSSGVSQKLGDIVAPQGDDSLSSGAVFHERYSGSSPSCSGTTSNLEKAGVTFSSISSNKSVGFNGAPLPNNIFSSSACKNFIHFDSTINMVSTGFGVTNGEYSPFRVFTVQATTPVAPTAPHTPSTPNKTVEEEPKTTETKPEPEPKPEPIAEDIFEYQMNPIEKHRVNLLPWALLSTIILALIGEFAAVKLKHHRNHKQIWKLAFGGIKKTIYSMRQIARSEVHHEE